MRMVCRWCPALLAACLPAACLLAGAAVGRAQPPKPPDSLDRKAIDKIIYQNLRDVINRGADLYNLQQDYAGCYRLYEGALMAVRPFLDHRPELQKAIGTGTAEAAGEPVMFRRAFILRAVIDKIRADVNPNPKPPPVAKKTLWDRLGGKEGVSKVVDDLVAAAAADKDVDFFRGKPKPPPEEIAELKEKVVEFFSKATGGPLEYTGKDMKAAHKGMGITDAQFDAFAKHLEAALKKNGAQPADIALVMKAVEGTRKDIVESKKAAKTLWERLGGEEGVTRVVDDLVKTAGTDKNVDFFRGGKYKLNPAELTALKKKIVAYISSKTGGPLEYKGKDMKEAHKGMGITDAQFDAFVKHFKDALEKNDVADADVKAVLSAVEGTRKDIVEAKKVGGGDTKPAETADITGHVVYKGKPLPAGTVTFTPDKGAAVSAAIGADGTFDVKAIPTGTYRVSVTAGAGGVKIPAKYGDPKTSALTYNATKGRQTLDLDLKE